MHRVYQTFVEQAESTHILVVGDVMLDEYVSGTVTRISPEAPVPIIETSGTSYALGGAANVANNLRALGCRASLMGVIGLSDGSSEIFLREVGVAGIDSRGIIESTSRPTTRKTRIMAHNQQMLRVDHEKADMIDEIELGFFLGLLCEQEPDAIIFSDYANGMFHPTLFRRLVEISRDREIPLAVDPKGTQWQRYRGATAITPNEDELRAAIGNCYRDLHQYALSLYGLIEFQELLITQGSMGMTLFQSFSRDDIKIQANPAHPVFDVCGAGDTVMAVFALGLALKQDPVATARLANLAAGIVVGKIGTSTASMEEIDQDLQRSC